MARNPHGAFTLVELLASIAIMAVLATAAVYFTASYVQWSKSIADQRTLTVLNDALTRYKCEGGNVNTLTLGAPIGNIISRLQTPVNWAGNGGHQFLQLGVTYPARSLSSTGTYSQYHFYQYNSYKAETLSASTPTSTYPYGQGTGYIAVNKSLGGTLWVGVSTSTGYFAMKDDHGNTTVYHTGAASVPNTSSSYTFWSCQDATHSTASGNVTDFGISSLALTGLDIRGLPSITNLGLNGSSVGPTTLNISGCTNLTSVDISDTPNISQNPSNQNAFYQLLPNRPSHDGILAYNDSGTDIGVTTDPGNILVAKGWGLLDQSGG